MRHPFLHGHLYGAEDDLTPDEMARVASATAEALRDVQCAARDLENLNWALIGGQALISYGVPRITTDIDVLTPYAGELAIELFERYGWMPLFYDQEVGDYVETDRVFGHEMQDPVLFDVKVLRVMYPLRSPNGMIVELLMAQHPVEIDMIEDALLRKIHGQRVPVAPLGGVLLVKVKANRIKDIAAVEQTAETLSHNDLSAALEWAENRDPTTTEDMKAIFDQVKERRRPTRIEPYVRRKPRK